MKPSVEPLEEKLRAQRALAEKAARQSTSYEQVVEEEVKALFRARGRRLVFSRRKGEWPHAPAARAKSK